MTKHYTYLVSCVRETSIEWGIELQSLGDSVPPKVVRLPHLTRPLTESPYFQSKCNPITYFKQLIKGMTDMLRDYHTRVFRKIQSRLEKLEVGERCYVQISYTDNGAEIKPHNYEIQLLKQSPFETQDTNSAGTNADTPSVSHGEETVLGWKESTQSSDREHANSSVENTAEVIKQVTQLQERVRELQSDMDLMKERFAAERRRSGRILGENGQYTPRKTGIAEESNAPRIGNGRMYMRPAGGRSQQKKDSIMLNQDESTAIQYIMDQKIITESQLRKQYHIGNASEVMAGLIDKMEQYNSPWIDVQKDENGKLVYHWNQPDEGVVMATSNTS